MIQIKNAAELEKMRKAAAISAAALKAGGEAIEPGITTAEIDKIIYDFIVRHGARPNFLHLYGFPATACISVNDTVIHGIPSRDQKIRPGDIVSIDTGCKIDGFNGDNACTFACGKLDLEAQRLLDVTKESLHLGIAAAQAGARVGDIGHAVQSYVEENGFSVVREYVGHGVGKELHEDPEIPNYGHAGRGQRLMPGMCIAIEPMICQYKCAVKTLKDGWTVKTCDGGLAAHFEHTVVDPVMGDHGRMYRGLAPEMVPAMYTLCSRASLILPNTTEAALLLGDPMPGVTGEAELHTAQAQAQRLTRICPRVLITGVAAGRGIACVGADRATGESLVRTPMVPKSFHGTGDIFGAVLVGRLLQGNVLPAAAQAAAVFVADCLKATPDEADERLGVWLESVLPRLMQNPE